MREGIRFGPKCEPLGVVPGIDRKFRGRHEPDKLVVRTNDKAHVPRDTAWIIAVRFSLVPLTCGKAIHALGHAFALEPCTKPADVPRLCDAMDRVKYGSF